MKTEITVMKDMLDKLKEDRDFDKLFDYTLYLAERIIDSNRIGRAAERVYSDLLTKRQKRKFYTRFLDECISGDEFCELEKEFYEHFAHDELDFDKEDE